MEWVQVHGRAQSERDRLRRIRLAAGTAGFRWESSGSKKNFPRWRAKAARLPWPASEGLDLALVPFAEDELEQDRP